ncbi:MAG TPA: DUF3429 domain-containing protein [Acetobacteraceae bacterium]|nr:DUF3429 domain-containing protein [Acetobacteraceae bacterium]
MTESRLPLLAVILSGAGLVPFFITALGAVRHNPPDSTLDALALITYSAVVLSFVGGVHWGFVLEGEQEPAERERLVLGVLPGLIGWGAALLGLLLHPTLAIALLIAGFIGTAIIEARGRRRELVPHGYMIMRWALTVVVVVILTTVLGVRAIGGSLIF